MAYSGQVRQSQLGHLQQSLTSPCQQRECWTGHVLESPEMRSGTPGGDPLLVPRLRRRTPLRGQRGQIGRQFPLRRVFRGHR